MRAGRLRFIVVKQMNETNMIEQFEDMKKILNGETYNTIRLDAPSQRAIKWAVASYFTFCRMYPQFKPIYESARDYGYEKSVPHKYRKYYYDAEALMDLVKGRIFAKLYFRLCSSKDTPENIEYMPAMMSNKIKRHCTYCGRFVFISPRKTIVLECPYCGMKVKHISVM